MPGKCCSSHGGLMKTLKASSIILRLLAMCVALTFAFPSGAENGVGGQKVQIADGIYQFITAPDGYVPNGNSIVIVNEDDVLVFDTFSRPSTARTVLVEIRKITDKPVRYVVNSHHHPDHWSGNEVYAEAFPGLEIIATEQSRKFMLNIASAWPAVFQEKLRKDQASLDEEIKSDKDAEGGLLTAEEGRQDEDDVRLERDFVGEALGEKRTYPTL